MDDDLKTPATPIALIVAVARNGVIGRDNALPWHLPSELAYFKAQTLGKPILMGRKTYESIGRPLPGRTNIVVTRDPDYRADGVEVCRSLSAALALADAVARRDGAPEIMVIGGAAIFVELLPMTAVIYYTEVDLAAEGDVCFPAWSRRKWQETRVRTVPAGDGAPAYTLFEYRR